MKKIIIALIILVLGYFVYNSVKQNQQTTQSQGPFDMVLFWGDGCPHCEIVKKYISDNKVDSQLSIDQKEVYYNKSNQALMQQAAEKCQMDTSKGLGVPFAVIDDQCYVGDTPIIDAIKQKTSTK